MAENKGYMQYAMLFGTYLGGYWILKFILFPLGLTTPFLSFLFRRAHDMRSVSWGIITYECIVILHAAAVSASCMHGYSQCLCICSPHC